MLKKIIKILVKYTLKLINMFCDLKNKCNNLTQEQIYLLLLRYGVDADAQAYITANEATGVSLTDIEKSAINTFFVSLKAGGLWSKFYALYPIIGGTAAAHAINAKTPGTYNITWAGSVTHNANGILSDGLTGYGNTGFSPNLFTNHKRYSLSYYTRTMDSSNTTRCEMGTGAAIPSPISYTNPISPSAAMVWQGQANSMVTGPAMNNCAAVSFLTFASHVPSLYVGVHTETDTTLYYKRTTQVYSDSVADNTSATTTPIYVLANNETGVGANNHSLNNLCYVGIADSMSATDATNLYNAVQALQTSLGRNV